MARPGAAALAFLGILAAGAPALGADPVALPIQSAPSPVSDTPQRSVTSAAAVTRWYGYQTLLVDAASVGVMLAGTSRSGMGAPAFAGASTYALGAPIVHLVHGHADKAALDLGLRVVLPLGIGATIAATACSRSTGDGRDSCTMTSFIAGAVVGIPIAVVLDATTLARETVQPAPTLAIAPLVDAHSRGVAVTGTF